IYGYKKVQKQWQKIKQEILKDHKGEEVDSYIEHIEATVSDKALFVDFLGSNQMYGLFFNGQWQSLKDFYQGNAENALKIIQTEPFQKYIYKGTQIQEIQKELSNTKYKLLCLGTIL
ncbi:MAG: hypothetical protein Q4C98_11385, partial [Capnocytophaga sp.]|nr:hypothetical protein [Capnocytophaga sp.]